ncbi:hypothetical protein ACFONL_15775 [Camelimonas fluminis]|uniref:Cytidyltransferase-like domain-containing protein n=1 Tax=Camelimonas fluminis TaxID=1576911 RepID=A0ABV7UKJ0_9HYPH|nr:hypothetical protein [Camelimonas fluminis]
MPSVRLAACVGVIMYLSYAWGHAAWSNLALVSVSVIVCLLLPAYSRVSNRVEELVNHRWAVVTFGRLGRFAAQYLFNVAVFGAFLAGGVVPDAGFRGLGGVAGAALLTTLASQGVQYMALALYNRGVGDQNRNVLAALSINIVATALSTTGAPLFRHVMVIMGCGFGGLVFGLGVLSDLRGHWFPRRGIGVFFGTFNPFHVTHVDIIRQALDGRGLAKVIVHPTVVPRLHARALEKGEIAIIGNDGGLDVMERTAKADAHVNYFPTGKRFYPPQTRRALIAIALAEAGLAGRVEVLWLPEVYRDHGFHGVIARIRKLHPGVPLHGLHGSDLGGMWVRSIYDECGWIYPMPVRRRNNVSATAIRNGAAGMTTPVVGEVIARLREGVASFATAGVTFQNSNGLLSVRDRHDA